MVNITNLNASAQHYCGKTVNVFKTSVGKHLEMKGNSTLNMDRGISDIWCNTHPKTGDKMLYLEDSQGNLIREFNLNNQLEQVRHYFNKVNATKNAVIDEYKNLNKELKEVVQKCKPFDDKLKTEHIGRDNEIYNVDGKKYISYFEAKNDALSKIGTPELLQSLEKRREIERKLFNLKESPETNKYL